MPDLMPDLTPGSPDLSHSSPRLQEVWRSMERWPKMEKMEKMEMVTWPNLTQPLTAYCSTASVAADPRPLSSLEK